MSEGCFSAAKIVTKDFPIVHTDLAPEMKFISRVLYWQVFVNSRAQQIAPATQVKTSLKHVLKPPQSNKSNCQLCSACFTIPLVGPGSYRGSQWHQTQEKLHCDKNALSSNESRCLAIIKNEEAIRPRTVLFLSSEPRAASEKVKLCSRPTVTQKKNKTARDLGGDSFYTK